MKKHITHIATGLLLSAMATQASAFDIEIDPTAYLFSGHSVHFGFGGDNFRFDIGTFGLEAPEAFHGDENYDLEFEGIGIKLDYLFGNYAGWFVGVEANSNEVTYTRKSTNETVTRQQFSLGPRVGYRIMYTQNITITPWLGIDLNLEHDDVILDGERFESEAVTFFPAVHLGWRF
ncbi:MAG: outer membrane beta-barrel protein [Marinomonas sp.]